MQAIRLWEKGSLLSLRAYAATFACESALEQEEPANGFRSVSAVEGGALPCGIGGYAPLNASHCFAISAFFIIRILHDSLHLFMLRARYIRKGLK